MKVKLLKDVPVDKTKRVPKGQIVLARLFATVPFQFNPPYQVIDGPLTGTILSREECMEIEEEKTFTEKQWNEMKKSFHEQFEREREKTGRAQELVRDLTKDISAKNKEIEKLSFFLECSNLALTASCKAIEVLNEKNAN